MKSIFKEKYMDKTIVNSAMTAAELKEARQGSPVREKEKYIRV